MTLADVRKPDVAARFGTPPRTAEALNLGLSRSAYWLRLNLRNSGDQPVQRMLELAYAGISDLGFYQPTAQGGEGGYRSVNTGKRLPFASRAYPHRFFVFPVTLPAHAEQVVYLRIASTSPILVPARLWAPAAFHAYERNDYLGQAWYFGIATAMILFNLLLFIALRDVIYLVYVTLTTCLAFTIAAQNGLTKEFLWHDAPRWSELAAVTGVSFTFAAALTITRLMLETRKFLPRLDLLLKLLVGIFLLSPIAFALSYHDAVRPHLLLQFAATSLTLGLGVYCAFKRQRTAYFFLAAFAGPIVGTLTNILRSAGVLPLNVFTSNALQLGSAAEMLLLALALADRFNMLRREKEVAQQEAYWSKHRLVESLKSSELALERRVVERTEQLRDALGQATAANQAKSTLLAHISHDLRAPLSTIIGYARAWWGQAPDPSVPQAIERNARNQLTLIDDLLEYACIDLHEAVLDPQPGSLLDFLNEVGDDAHQLAGNAGLSFALVLDPALPGQVEADFKRLRQVLMNLLSNGAKFTACGGIILRVNALPSARVGFEVVDTGPGMPPDECERIFEPFESGAARAKLTGVGLGLAISRHYVEKMGGTLEVDSTPGQGSRFHFALALTAALQAAPDAAGASR